MPKKLEKKSTMKAYNLTDTDIEEMKYMYEVEKLSLKQISNKVGISDATVRRRLTELGVKMRPALNTLNRHRIAEFRKNKTVNRCIFCKTSLTKKDPAFVCTPCQLKEWAKSA